MQEHIYQIAITIYQRDNVWEDVNSILHAYAPHLLLRVGYPMKEKNLAIIFLVAEISSDTLGALTGKLGQIQSVKVKSSLIKTEEK